MAKLSAKQKKYMLQKNTENFKNKVKIGEPEICSSTKRQSNVGKGDADRVTNKKAFDANYDSINWLSKTKQNYTKLNSIQRLKNIFK